MNSTGIAAALAVVLVLPAAAHGAEKGQISETGLEELANPKGGGAAAVEKAIKELERGGLKITGRAEVLGKLVGASYCAQGGSGGAAFTLCAYDDAAAAGKGAAKRAAMLGEKNAEHANGALVLSIVPAADEKAAKAGRKLADLFAAIGAKPDPGKQ